MLRKIAGKIVRKIKSVLAFDLRSQYLRLLENKELRAPDKPLSDRHVVMMTGGPYLKYARLAVFAIARNWKSLPRLTIVNDGSLTNEEIRNRLGFWKGQLHIAAWQESVDFHKSKNRPALARYAELHPFGKKMAIILQHAELSPVLWVDSDILFYKDPCHYLPEPETDFMCGATEDWFKAYDQQVLDLLPGHDLDVRTPMNAGLLYVYGKNIYEKFNLEQLIEQIHPNYAYFTEQTTFAYIASKSLGIMWDQSVIKNTGEDGKRFIVPVPKTQVARHYTSNMRTLFWRDAMFNLYLNWRYPQ